MWISIFGSFLSFCTGEHNFFLVGDLVAGILAFSIVLMLTVSGSPFFSDLFIVWKYVVPGIRAKYLDADYNENQSNCEYEYY